MRLLKVEANSHISYLAGYYIMQGIPPPENRIGPVLVHTTDTEFSVINLFYLHLSD